MDEQNPDIGTEGPLGPGSEAGSAAGPPEEGREGALTSRAVRLLGRFGFGLAREAGRAGILFAAMLSGLRHPRRYLRETVRQAKFFGVDSVVVVVGIALLGGSVVAQQSGYQFDQLPYWVIGESVAAATITETAPLLSALVLAGRVGAGMAAELGTMKVTDQLDALRTLGRDPVVELVVPRVLGSLLVIVPLTVLAIVASLASGWLTSLALFPMTTSDYVFGLRDYYHTTALVFSLFKALTFGFTISFLACYVGFQTEEGASGVGRASTRAAVAIIVAVLMLDVSLAPVYKAIK